MLVSVIIKIRREIIDIHAVYGNILMKFQDLLHNESPPCWRKAHGLYYARSRRSAYEMEKTIISKGKHKQQWRQKNRANE